MAGEPVKLLKIADLKGKDVRTVHVIPWPGLPDRKVGLLELRCGEQLEAYFAAREIFSRKGWENIDVAANPHFGAELELQYVFRMLVDPETTTADPRFRIFASVDEARARLDPDERAHFATAHVGFENDKVMAWMPKTECGEQP